MYRIAAKKVHTYFFLKGLDAVRDGGVVAFITSQSVLNTEGNGSTRYLMMKQADLLSAIVCRTTCSRKTPTRKWVAT